MLTDRPMPTEMMKPRDWEVLPERGFESGGGEVMVSEPPPYDEEEAGPTSDLPPVTKSMMKADAGPAMPPAPAPAPGAPALPAISNGIERAMRARR